MAKGDIIIWLNADDIFFYRDSIKDIVKHFLNNNVDVVYSNMAIIDEKNYLIKIQFSPPFLNYKLFSLGHFAPCISYKKDIVKKFLLDPKFIYVLDYEQVLRMASKGAIFGYTDKILIAWRKHGDTKSVKGKNKIIKEVNLLKKHHISNKNIFYLKFFIMSYLLIRKIFGIINIIQMYQSKINKYYFISYNNFFRTLLRQIFI
jgi:hypothetical protein